MVTLTTQDRALQPRRFGEARHRLDVDLLPGGRGGRRGERLRLLGRRRLQAGTSVIGYSDTIGNGQKCHYKQLSL